MPVKRSLAKRSKRLCDYKRLQLLEGPEETLLGGVGYLAGYNAGFLDQLGTAEQAEVLATMERDWRANRDELMAWWNAGRDAPHFSPKPWIFPHYGTPDTLPWAAEQFDNGETK